MMVQTSLTGLPSSKASVAAVEGVLRNQNNSEAERVAAVEVGMVGMVGMVGTVGTAEEKVGRRLIRKVALVTLAAMQLQGRLLQRQSMNNNHAQSRWATATALVRRHRRLEVEALVLG